MLTRKVSLIRPGLFMPLGCPDIYPGIDQNQLLQTEVSYYCATANGAARIFTDHDRMLEYDSSVILNPDRVSYINLFINGMLQPPILYDVRRGVLLLKSMDVPPAGAVIMLQFVKILMPPS